MSDIAQRLANLSPAQRQLLESRLKGQPQVAQPIAVVGMACRLPGAPNLDAYWDLITGNRHAFREIPADRWSIDAFYDRDPDAPGKMATRCFASIDDVAGFDAVFFGISPREAAKMDPQQRLLLEVTWEAMEHAGIAPQQLAGSPVGVFVGIGGTDYAKVPASFDNYYEVIDGHVGTGNALSIASNRISYIFDFRGPSLSIDTACSSGLVALHAAMLSLRLGECDAALAGAVNLILTPEVTIAFSKSRMLSPSGVCRPFDSRADGYVRGEGCGMLVLKRLTDAIRDQDNILAVLRGSAVNQDGRTSGITAPNSLSQQACIRAALAAAGTDTAHISYIEAHGTGTPLGDPIEVQSLAKLYAARGSGESPVYFGSVKANVGHTETVSGIAGLIKVILMLGHEQIPPQFGLEAINANIDLKGTRLRIPQTPIPWPRTDPHGVAKPRLAGVSSFGFGGTNTHVIVESAGSRPALESEIPPRPSHLLAFSAKSKQAIGELSSRLADRLEQVPDEAIGDFCYSANTGRSHFHQRVAIVADSRQKLLEGLRAAAADKKSTAVKRGEVTIARRPQVAFLFTGQGAQYSNMGKGLFETHPEFRQTILRCEEILRDSRPVPLTEVLYPREDRGLVNATEYTQPALFAVEYALANLWRGWGVEPAIVLGHSVGEYVAACIAGVFSLEDGLRLIAKRAELMQALPPNGTMAALFALRDRVEELIKPWADRVTVATANGPENNVISGETAAIEEVLATCQRAGIGTQRLVVSHAFHSPLMDPMLDAFEAFARTLTYGRPTIPLVANRTGSIVQDASLQADYWRDHLRNAVEFARGMESIEQFGVDAYLEAGPAATLVGMGKRCLPDSAAAWVGSLRKGKDDWETILTAARDLYVHGVNFDWHGFDRIWPRRRIQLPNYPFHRTRHWYVGETSRFGGTRGPGVHPLLGSPVETALSSKVYELRLSADSPKYLKDHQVQGAVVVPAAAFVEQGLALAHELFGEGAHAVENLSVQRGLYLPAEGHRLVQVTVGPEANGRATYDVFSTDPNSHQQPPNWEHHVSATLAHASTLPAAAPTQIFDPNRFASRVKVRQTHDEFYGLMTARSLVYGPAFQGVVAPDRSDEDALTALEIPPAITGELEKYLLHPGLGDAMFQMIGGTIPLEENGDHTPYAYIPMRARMVRKHGPLEGPLFIYGRRVSADSRPSPESVTADLFILNARHEVLVECRGLTVQRVGRPIIEKASANVEDWIFGTHWVEAPLGPTDGATSASSRTLVISDASGIGEGIARTIEASGEVAILVRPGDTNREISPKLWELGVDQEDLPKLWERLTAADEFSRIVYLAAMDAPAIASDSYATWRLAVLERPLQLVQRLARIQGPKPVLLAVTRGAQGIEGSVTEAGLRQSPLLGFLRSALNEFPEIPSRSLDLDAALPQASAIAAIVAEARFGDDEPQVAVRGERRLVPRLRSSMEVDPLAANAARIPRQGDFRLRIQDAGSFDGLRFESYVPPTPGPGQVTIDVRATGLNFSDVLKAMGLYPGIRDEVVPLGIECSGIVTAVGPDVTRFRIGDAVMGVAPHSFASKTVTAEYALVRKPERLNHIEAATIPITFLTAYYALVRLAQVQSGERVLIHAGAGGVGIAAIQIAKHLGAEIFATAGSDAKRDYLRGLGVHHVMNSRTLEFAEQILEQTHREGIDVVLNSLPGDAIAKSLGVLRAYGRFLEIGKTDIYANTMVGLLPFQDNLSYFAIDLDRMLRQRPEYIRTMFEELIRYFEEGVFHPLPCTQFPAADTVDAFRYMAQRKNTGKVVVDMARGSDTASRDETRRPSVRPQATYLVTGGLGALGLQVAAWLRGKGATHVALMARREPDESATTKIRSLRQQGLDVLVLRGDVADLESLEAALTRFPAGQPPLRGVFHAAGVLADGLIYDMTLDRLAIPLESKVLGTWNLRQALAAYDLDFFVGFSSVASLLGSPGQSNYAAANAFLDSFAIYRRGLGQAGLSVQWGPWADGGMAANKGTEGQLTGRGMNPMPAAKAFEALDRLLAAPAPIAAVMHVSWKDLLAGSQGRIPHLLREIVTTQTLGAREDTAEDRILRESLRSAPLADRRKQLVGFFADQLAHVTGLAVEDINPAMPLNTFGMDSLMAIELKNKIEGRLQITLPMTAFLQEPCVNSLANQAADAFESSGSADGQAAFGAGKDGAANGSPPHTSGQSPKFLQSRNRPAESVP